MRKIANLTENKGLNEFMKEKEKKTNLCFVSNKGLHYAEFLRHSDKKQIPSVTITLNRLTLNFPHPNSNNLIPFLFFFFYVFCRTKNLKTSWILALLDVTEQWKDFLCVSQTHYSSEPLINLAGDYRREGDNIAIFVCLICLICKIK